MFFRRTTGELRRETIAHALDDLFAFGGAVDIVRTNGFVALAHGLGRLGQMARSGTDMNSGQDSARDSHAIHGVQVDFQDEN